MQKDLNPTDLAALISSRICHDLISPVGAITNGLEVMGEDGAEDMRDFALELIGKSAAQASSKLQFCRMAFGASGSAGLKLDTGEAEQVAQQYMQFEKAKLIWDVPKILLPKSKVKLILNLIPISTNAIPRGGEVKVTLKGEDEQATICLEATGTGAKEPEHFMEFVQGVPDDKPVDAHVVLYYYAGLLARDAGLTISCEVNGESLTILAQ